MWPTIQQAIGEVPGERISRYLQSDLLHGRPLCKFGLYFASLSAKVCRRGSIRRGLIRSPPGTCKVTYWMVGHLASSAATLQVCLEESVRRGLSAGILYVSCQVRQGRQGTEGRQVSCIPKMHLGRRASSENAYERVGNAFGSTGVERERI